MYNQNNMNTWHTPAGGTSVNPAFSQVPMNNNQAWSSRPIQNTIIPRPGMQNQPMMVPVMSAQHAPRMNNMTTMPINNIRTMAPPNNFNNPMVNSGPVGQPIPNSNNSWVYNGVVTQNPNTNLIKNAYSDNPNDKLQQQNYQSINQTPMQTINRVQAQNFSSAPVRGNKRPGGYTEQIVNGKIVTLDKSGQQVPGPYRNLKKEQEEKEKRKRENEERMKMIRLNQQRQSAFVPYLFIETSLLGLTEAQIENCEKVGKTPLFLRLNSVLEMDDIQSRIFRPLWFSSDDQQINIVINTNKFAIRLEEPGKDQWKLKHLLAKWIVEFYHQDMMDVLRGGGLTEIHDQIMAWSPARCIREKCKGYSFEIVSGAIGKPWTVKMVLNGTETVAEETASSQEEAENTLSLNFFHNPENNEKFLSLCKMPEEKLNYERKEVPGIKNFVAANTLKKKLEKTASEDEEAEGPDSKKQKQEEESSHRVKVPIDTSNLHKKIEIDYEDLKEERKVREFMENKAKEQEEKTNHQQQVSIKGKAGGHGGIKSRQQVIAEELAKGKAAVEAYKEDQKKEEKQIWGKDVKGVWGLKITLPRLAKFRRFLLSW